jgi:nucleosome binding factor SPN SPT16 subunit
MAIDYRLLLQGSKENKNEIKISVDSSSFVSFFPSSLTQVQRGGSLMKLMSKVKRGENKKVKEKKEKERAIGADKIEDREKRWKG